MKEEVKQQLFKIFADFTRTEKGEITTSGIGLGLSISQQLVQSLKGSIKVESAENQGTEVQFRIRVKQEQCENIH